MWRRIITSLFFSNWFLGILAIALSLETSFQLTLPLNSALWYLILFSAVVLYYTYAYQSAGGQGVIYNPRTEWYRCHQHLVHKSQLVLLTVFLVSGLFFFFRTFKHFTDLPLVLWIVPLMAVAAAASYYGKLRLLNLRFAGWTKPLTIGFCWAVAVSLLPLMALELEHGKTQVSWQLASWLFLKNWMFCSVNAILFDIKDFEDDTNRALKTFVVRFGVRFTIFSILLPMIALGVMSFLLFAGYRDFNFLQITINLIPFLLTFFIAWSLQQKRSILYYLIVIDGMLLIKALCGIIASTFTTQV